MSQSLIADAKSATDGSDKLLLVSHRWDEKSTTVSVTDCENGGQSVNIGPSSGNNGGQTSMAIETCVVHQEARSKLTLKKWKQRFAKRAK